MSENTFKRSLARSTYNARSESEVKAIIVRRMLNDLDGIVLKYWSALGDMGMTAAEFKKLKIQVKKRL